MSKSSVPDEACVYHTPLVVGRMSRLLIRPVTNLEPNSHKVADSGPSGVQNGETVRVLAQKGNDFGANLEPKPTHLDIGFLLSFQSQDKEAFGSQKCQKGSDLEPSGLFISLIIYV